MRSSWFLTHIVVRPTKRRNLHIETSSEKHRIEWTTGIIANYSYAFMIRWRRFTVRSTSSFWARKVCSWLIIKRWIANKVMTEYRANNNETIFLHHSAVSGHNIGCVNCVNLPALCRSKHCHKNTHSCSINFESVPRSLYHCICIIALFHTEMMFACRNNATSRQSLHNAITPFVIQFITSPMVGILVLCASSELRQPIEQLPHRASLPS